VTVLTGGGTFPKLFSANDNKQNAATMRANNRNVNGGLFGQAEITNDAIPDATNTAPQAAGDPNRASVA